MLWCRPRRLFLVLSSAFVTVFSFSLIAQKTSGRSAFNNDIS